MVNFEQEKEDAWKKAVEKVQNMTNESLLTIWEALRTSAAWLDNHYSEHITLDEWAELVYFEKDKRGI